MSHGLFHASDLAQFKPRLYKRLRIRWNCGPGDTYPHQTRFWHIGFAFGAILKPKNARAGKTLNVPGCD
jgi:hypothetical protein